MTQTLKITALTPVRAKAWLVSASVAGALVLGACGGGNDPAPPGPTDAVPASATTSVAGLVSYLQALIGSSADTLMPVDLSTVPALPTDDTAQPTPLT